MLIQHVLFNVMISILNKVNRSDIRVARWGPNENHRLINQNIQKPEQVLLNRSHYRDRFLLEREAYWTHTLQIEAPKTFKWRTTIELLLVICHKKCHESICLPDRERSREVCCRAEQTYSPCACYWVFAFQVSWSKCVCTEIVHVYVSTHIQKPYWLTLALRLVLLCSCWRSSHCALSIPHQRGPITLGLPGPGAPLSWKSCSWPQRYSRSWGPLGQFDTSPLLSGIGPQLGGDFL